MNFTVRPSKSFCFDVLEGYLTKLNRPVGLDAGSAHLRNRGLFHTARYYGLDLRKEDIRQGLSRFPGDDTLGIHADLQDLKKLPSNSVDVVVSTNTLYHLPKDSIAHSIEELIRVLTPDGTIIVELPLDQDYDARERIFTDRLSDVNVIYYKNTLSRFYEGCFERDGFLGAHPVAGSKPFLALAWVISRIEFLTCHFRSVNTHALIVGKTKKEKESSQPFDLSQLPFSERIYDLIG